MDRFLSGVAYLDGRHPSAVFARGYYTRTTLIAYRWEEKRPPLTPIHWTLVPGGLFVFQTDNSAWARYAREVQRLLATCSNLEIVSGEVADIEVTESDEATNRRSHEGSVEGSGRDAARRAVRAIKLSDGTRLTCRAVIVTTGTRVPSSFSVRVPDWYVSLRVPHCCCSSLKPEQRTSVRVPD